MAEYCYDIYVIWRPPDPSSVVSGNNNPYGSTIVMTSPPGFDLGGGTCTKVTVCNELPDPPPYVPPTGTYTPPGGDEEELVFEEIEEDGETYYEAPLPDTGGEEWDFEINVPMEDGESPETTPLRFTGASFRASGTIGETVIYVLENGKIHRVSGTGTVLKTWSDIYFDGVHSHAETGAVIFASNVDLYFLNSSDELVNFASFDNMSSAFIGFTKAGDFYITYDDGSSEGLAHIIEYDRNNNFAQKQSRAVSSRVYNSSCPAPGLAGEYFFENVVGIGDFDSEIGKYEREYATIAKHTSSGVKIWEYTFDDWNYGETYHSKEVIWGIASDAAGNAYCVTIATSSVDGVSTTYTRVHKLSNAGALLWSTIAERPAFGEDSKVLIVSAQSGYSIVSTSDTQIAAVDSSGGSLWSKSFSNAVVGFQIGEDGDIYVFDSGNNIYKINRLGETVWTAEISV